MALAQYPVKADRHSSEPGWVTSHLSLDYCEQLYEYNDGGLCPILVDDVLSGHDIFHEGVMHSFKIVGKLGRGSYSTVWLGRDVKSDQFIALKVLKREHSTPENSEMKILRKLGKLQMAFFHTNASTQDQFLCLGMVPLGSNLSGRRELYIGVPDTVSSITMFVKSLVMKVFDFHRQGIIHGDISHNNVALGIHKDAFTPDSLEETFGEDLKIHIVLRGVSESEALHSTRPANLPEYIVEHELPLRTNSTDMSLVDIIDFGKAFEAPSKANVFGTSLYSSPEAQRDSSGVVTTKSDLWSLGCVIIYGLTSDDLFWLKEHRELYFAGNHEVQLSIIDKILCHNYCLVENTDFKGILAQLVHSLVQVDPSQRDPRKAMGLLSQLENYV